MFEKEAEKLFKKKATRIAEKKVKEFYKECGWEDYKYMIPEFADVGTKCMQKGAEFGYNKANEWHYVKDGDYPKYNKSVLCILGDIDSDNCEVGYYNDVGSGEPWHFETYHLPDNDGDNAWGVSAWKEIVLPKEVEE